MVLSDRPTVSREAVRGRAEGQIRGCFVTQKGQTSILVAAALSGLPVPARIMHTANPADRPIEVRLSMTTSRSAETADSPVGRSVQARLPYAAAGVAAAWLVPVVTHLVGADWILPPLLLVGLM